MAESVGGDDDVSLLEDINYRKAKALLRKISEEMDVMKGNEVHNSERLEMLQQKAIDINKVIEFVERAFENVEEDEWRFKLPASQPSLERNSVRQDDLREINETREPTSQKSRTNEAALGAPAMLAKPASYQPPESYRRSSEPSRQLPYQPPRAFPPAPSPSSPIHAAQQQNLRPGPQPNEDRQVALSPHATRNSVPPIPNFVEDDNYEVPSNISFNHGPFFSDCIASMKLSDTVYDLADAREDLVKTKEKLRKAEERDDAEKADRYKKRVAKTEKEARELEADHWRLEVEPLRRAYRFEVSGCLRQLEVAIKYTEALQSGSPEAQQKQGRVNALEDKALHDMGLLHKWLELCLRQPKTWRKDDQLLVGLIEGHPRSSLKDPEYVEDLLQETAEAEPTSRRKPKTNSKEPKSAADDSVSASAPRLVKVTPDLLEGLLNGAMPKEVAESIQECPECKGDGGDTEHAKICSDCDGAGANKDRDDGVIEMCPKCSGRGFRLSKKYLCPTCDGFKIVLRLPEEEEPNTRDTNPPTREADTAPKRSSSIKRAAFDREVPSDSGTSRKHRDESPDETPRTKSKKHRDDSSDEAPRTKSKKHRDDSSDEAPRPKVKKHRDDSSDEAPRPKAKKHRDDSPDEATRSPISASRGTSRRRRHSESRRPQDPTQNITAVLAEVFKASKEPGSWTGEKGRRVLSAAMAAGSGAADSGEASDSGKSEGEDDDYDRKPRRKRRGSTRH